MTNKYTSFVDDFTPIYIDADCDTNTITITDKDLGYNFDYNNNWESLDQNEIKDLKILLEIFMQLPDDHEIKQLFNTQKALNTLRGSDEN